MGELSQGYVLTLILVEPAVYLFLIVFCASSGESD